MRNRARWISGCIMLAAMSPGFVAAQSDWNGSEQQAKSSPALADHSLHAAWRVHLYGQVEASYIHVEGASGERFLVLADRGEVVRLSPGHLSSVAISTPSRPLEVPEGSLAELIYVDQRLSLILYMSGAGSILSIELDSSHPD